MKETIISKQRTKFAFNRQSIEKAIGLSTLEYNNVQFERGIAFLEERFPRHTEYDKYFVLYSRSKAFWKWWTTEWAIWEDDLVAYINTHNINLKVDFYVSDFKATRTQQRLESSFHNHFLKSFQEVII